MKPQSIPPPDHLSDRAKALWHHVVPTHAHTPNRLVLVQTALEALDRADQAREQIDREGLTFTTKTTGAVHMNPALKLEKEARAQFVAVWVQALRFNWLVGKDG